MSRALLINQIRRASRDLQSLTDQQLRQRSLELKHVAMLGASKRELIVRGFPMVVESARRCLGMVHHDVQLHCGIEAVHGRIAEMKTGEGKTLTASLIGYLFSLYGQGVHMVTFNEYLAERDCEHLSNVYRMLGMTVAVLTEKLTGSDRAAAYQCDITYGAAKEFGFDFLRDRLLSSNGDSAQSGVMRGTKYALIDEADSILIDEARTPLIIGVEDPAQTKFNSACARWACQYANRFLEQQHFKYDPMSQRVTLTADGVMLARLLPAPGLVQAASVSELYEFIHNAIKACRDLIKDRDYAVRNGEVVIIDEYTGRLAEGRQWQRGLHQAVQAKEGLEITPATRTAASITVQSFFRRYKLFGGMTGTAWTSRHELWKVYRKRVARIPTHRPVNRSPWEPRVFANTQQKFAAVSKSAAALVEQGRSVLIGTRSVKQSEALAQVLDTHGLKYQILNAKHLAREAEIIAAAGECPTVTIATNMAGRGTDIRLSDNVRKAGGLHVILTEIHPSARIDWQLIGRGARQGDPGSFQMFVALDDEILELGYGVEKAKQFARKYEKTSSERLKWTFRLFMRAQRIIERRYLIDRLILLRNDFEKKKSYGEMGQDPYLSEA